MNKYITTLNTIITECGIEKENINQNQYEMKEENDDIINTYHQIMNEIDEIKKLQKKQSFARKKKFKKISILQLTIEIRSKKQHLEQLIDSFRLQLFEQQNDNALNLLKSIENEMKILNDEEMKEKKKKHFKRNKSFHIKGLEQYNMNEIVDESDDKRLISIKQNDNQINQKMDTIEQNVNIIKEITHSIHSKIDDQEDKIISTKEKMISNVNKIDTQQQKLRNIILSLHKPCNCCVTILLLCCIFGLFSIAASLLYTWI